jgi:hypothetical protein
VVRDGSKRIPVEREYDEGSGEEHAYVVLPGPTPKRKRVDSRSKELFRRVYPRVLDELIKLHLNATEWNVLIGLLKVMGFEGPFAYSNKELAERCEITPSKSSATVRSLKEKGILVERGVRQVMLNPELFWFGNDESRMQMIWQVEQEQKNRSGSATEDDGPGEGGA